MIPSMKLVSRFWMRTRTNAISFRVFSKITFGSSDSQRRQFGAITIARLLASILVTAAFSGAAKTCSRQAVYNRFQSDTLQWFSAHRILECFSPNFSELSTCIQDCHNESFYSRSFTNHYASMNACAPISTHNKATKTRITCKSFKTNTTAETLQCASYTLTCKNRMR